MDTDYLRSFVIVVESGSLAEAARHLDLNPATVAARVQSLEAELGVALIQRSGRFMRPTAAGLKVLEEAREILRNLRNLQALAHDGSMPGELRLGVFISGLPGFLPPVMARVYRRHPALQTFVCVGPSIELCRRVASGELDAALVIEPRFTLAKSCQWSPLLRDRLVLLAPAGLRGDDAQRLLRSQPFIRYDRTTPTGQMVDAYLRDRGILPQERLEVNGAFAIASVVASGLGVAIIPASSAAGLRDPGLAQLPLPGDPEARPIGLVWDRSCPRIQLVDLLLREARLEYTAAAAR